MLNIKDLERQFDEILNNMTSKDLEDWIEKDKEEMEFEMLNETNWQSYFDNILKGKSYEEIAEFFKKAMPDGISIDDIKKYHKEYFNF